MFTRISRRGSHLRAAARQAAARLRRFAAVLAAVACALLASVAVGRPPRPRWSATRQAGRR